MDRDLISQIQILIERDKLDMAMQRLHLALADFPDTAYLHLLMAEVHYRQEQYKEALRAVETSIGLDAENDHAFFKKAQIHMHLRDFRAAENAIAEALKITPDDPNYYGLKGHLCIMREQFKEAVEWAQKGLDLNPDHHYCNNIKSMAHNSMGESKSAYSHLEYMMERNPEDATTQSNMGFHFLRRGNIKHAKVHFAEALRIDPNFDYARHGMLEAVKAGNWSYRKFLQFSFFMERIGKRNRWALIIGLIVVIQFLKPLAPIYLFFVMWTWFSGPISEVFLIFDRYGKYLMDERHRHFAHAQGFLLGLSLLSAISVLFLGKYMVLPALACFLALVPVYRLESAEGLGAKAINILFILALVFSVAIGFVPLEGTSSGWLALTAIFASGVIYSWLVNLAGR